MPKGRWVVPRLMRTLGAVLIGVVVLTGIVKTLQYVLALPAGLRSRRYA